MMQFAWGHFSGQMVQQIAELAMKDFQSAMEKKGTLQELQKLAGVGDHGKRSNNVHRDTNASGVQIVICQCE